MARARLAGAFLSALIVGSCCCTRQERPEPGEGLCQTYMNVPLVLRGTRTLTDPPYVLATADFYNVAGGAVLIKVQVENVMMGGATDRGSVTVWSGSGDAPTTPTVPSSAPVYSSSGDVQLRHTTQHLDRLWDGDPKYWLFVEVKRESTAGGSLAAEYFRRTWTVNETGTPDEAHQLQKYVINP